MLENLIVELKKYDVTEVAYKTGVSSATIHNIISGRNINPTVSVVQKLQNFIEGKENELS